MRPAGKGRLRSAAGGFDRPQLTVVGCGKDMRRQKAKGKRQKLGAREQGTGNREQKDASAPFRFCCSLFPVPCSLTLAFCLLPFAFAALDAAKAHAATPQQISECLAQCVGFLRKSVENNQVEPSEMGIVAYAMLKAGESADSPAVRPLIDYLSQKKFRSGSYFTPAIHQFYEAGTDAMALSTANPERYAGRIDSIAGFIIQNQHPRGSWFYYQRNDTGGDTSITQYAILGLWAAARSGVIIPNSTWSRAALWHLQTQLSDGSFTYHPGERNLVTSPYSITVNGVSSLCIARLHLYPNGDYSIRVPGASGPPGDEALSAQESVQERPHPRPPAILRTLSLDSESVPIRPHRFVRSKSKSRSSGKVSVSLSEINAGIERGLAWLTEHYNISPSMQFPHYYLYGMERACALTGVETFNGHDWYAEGADLLVKTQARDGHFLDAIAGPRAGTAFAVLFLAKATASTLGHRPEKLFGGGLMIGGRGLPKNLSAVQVSSDGIRVRKLDAPVDQLLSELENPKSVKIEAVQQAIVDSVQSGDREKLIGQKDRLKRLARDPRAEVRRTVIWALARCSNIHDGLIFIRALDDPDLGVVIEANNALCWLSRRPKGFGRSVDPVADVPEDATERQKEDAVAAWRKQVRSDWREWYDSVRPYSEHNLPIDLPD
jgi:hypothetical protein